MARQNYRRKRTFLRFHWRELTGPIDDFACECTRGAQDVASVVGVAIIARMRRVVTQLSWDDMGLAQQFSASDKRDDRFLSGAWNAAQKTGAPVLATALASFECSVSELLNGMSHTIVIGNVVAVSLPKTSNDPLVYQEGEYHRLATEI